MFLLYVEFEDPTLCLLSAEYQNLLGMADISYPCTNVHNAHLVQYDNPARRVLWWEGPRSVNDMQNPTYCVAKGPEIVTRYVPLEHASIPVLFAFQSVFVDSQNVRRFFHTTGGECNVGAQLQLQAVQLLLSTMIGTPNYDNCVEAIALNVEFFSAGSNVLWTSRCACQQR